MALQKEIVAIAKQAKDASRQLSHISSDVKAGALEAMADGLLKKKTQIVRANKKDIANAKKAKRSKAFIERLMLNALRVKKMSDDLRAINALNDPIGEMIKMWTRPNGLRISKMRVPLGVVGIIYESRPNVTSDCAGLCLKAGNAVILRGGKESLHSNTAIFKVLVEAAEKSGLPKGSINLIPVADREAVQIMLKQIDYIDLIIPRGGESLIRAVVENSMIPVIKHYKGICHTYIDEYADLKMAEEVSFNAKVHRPSTCNAMECLLVHKAIAKYFLPGMVRRLKKAGVEIRGCAKTVKLCSGVIAATTEDYATEYLELILSVKIVNSFQNALDHIAKYGSQHSEAIVTNNFPNGIRFLKEVDAACVYINASTRFTDGNEFGLGAEIGVSTDKLHARGPMGLEELTTYKYIIMGNGQIRK
ncbi:MAG: glutamate-5-semialdehyde dehydrogenase [PVC group bacterium]|nr:glutamate-5-semialdehyde dehydrogenase [PVC group bacterium]